MRECQLSVDEIMGIAETNFCLLASFANREAADDLLVALSFVSKKSDGFSFPAGIRCGLFYNESDVIVMIGGSLSEAQIQEAKDAIPRSGRIWQIHAKMRSDRQPAEDSTSSRTSRKKRDWWRLWGILC